MAGAKLEIPEVRGDGLQLEEHRPFQERFWVAERVAWFSFAALILAALLGLTGSGGPLSRSVQVLDGAAIDYPRVLRWEAADEIVVRFSPGAAERTLTLSPAFAEAFQIEAIQPEPEHAIVGAAGASLAFAAEAGAAAEVTLHITPLAPGLQTISASVDDGDPRALAMLVLP